MNVLEYRPPERRRFAAGFWDILCLGSLSILWNIAAAAVWGASGFLRSQLNYSYLMVNHRLVCISAFSTHLVLAGIGVFAIRHAINMRNAPSVRWPRRYWNAKITAIVVLCFVLWFYSRVYDENRSLEPMWKLNAPDPVAVSAVLLAPGFVSLLFWTSDAYYKTRGNKSRGPV